MPLERSKATELMDLAASGNNDAFEALARSQQDRMYRLALAMGLSTADAAEACQETFLRAYRQRASWRPGSNVAAYLAAITANVTREIRRHRHREYLGLPPQVIEAAISEQPPRPGGVDIRKLAGAMELLPARQREALACRYLRRMNVAQTAAAMNCAQGTVKAAVFAALANLRKILGEPI